MPAVSKERRDFLCGSCELGDVHQRQLISRSSRLEQHRCSRLIKHDEPIRVLPNYFWRLRLHFRGELHRLSLNGLLLRARHSPVLLTWSRGPVPRESYVSRTNCRTSPLAWGRDLRGNLAAPKGQSDAALGVAPQIHLRRRGPVLAKYQIPTQDVRRSARASGRHLVAAR